MSLTQVRDVSVEDICKRTKPRKHYVYSIQVHWHSGPITPVYRSYSNLLELQEKLLRIEDFLLNNDNETPFGTLLKEKSFSERFTIKKRAKALKRMPVVQEFLKSVVHQPQHISGSDPVIKFFHPLPDDVIELDHEQAEKHRDMDRGGSKAKHIHHISEPFLLEQYVAIADYKSTGVNDISLNAGNVVEVIQKNEHGWWFVDLDKEVGWVPASYLEPRDGSMDDQVLEIFEEGEEETYISMDVYEPQLKDEVGFEMGKVVKVIQKNLDGWWLIKFEEKEGWAPSMYLREVASSQFNARQKGKQAAVRAMLRDTRLNSSSVLAGRRQTWDPSARKKSVKTNKANQAVSSSTGKDNSFTSKPARSYVNLEFHQVTKNPQRRRNPRQKQDPTEVRAGCRLSGESKSTLKVNSENSNVQINGLLKPRPLSMVEEEDPETVSRGTSPIPSPLLAQTSNNSSRPLSCSDERYHFRPIKLPEEETKKDFEFPVEETAHGSSSENAVIDSHGDEDKQPDVKDEDEEEGEEYTENMPELVNKKFYAMGLYEKEGEQEVNLRENAEVELLEESEGGWWLVRTSSHSVGWAPSNFLEKVRSLKTGGVEAVTESPDENIIEVTPIRPPKSPKILKMAEEISVEKRFWKYLQKGKEEGTCPIDEEDVDTKVIKEPFETKEDKSEVFTFSFDDYDYDNESGVCLRKPSGVKFMPPKNDPIDQERLQASWDGPGSIERSESVPSLAESEDFDDLPSG
ncbi:SH3 and PX domain-containing protein 2A-like isoform X2 [Stylophora pistillata]|uniref:SH3 and PX domain-containing protein 2A n=1 Tax=Stylophora pistillata TaxID=50429 RepID=A0A2B4RLS2_STYPI|nr:SH3 and PX domain-containing protein 2A-like isoform X2 [Stylophora pistillata]PFX17297.1 SH3 and PX domain-containing protein 2A [Stylophora pistillata]